MKKAVRQTVLSSDNCRTGKNATKKGGFSENNQGNQESRHFTIKLKESEYQMLYGLAAEKCFTMSEIIRELIYKQLGIDGANDGYSCFSCRQRQQAMIY